ncbi:aspartate carbamoyltransferase [Philodulcilactobacillus myokoensis]|uniref:Aspartate carbamoyltransferase n=1 Tax=Philodulcilactobacillus myokoensis TaxID=2929573 RepID=A0A9W6B2B2_9LACO|nr:aspartate carbamoyltransferase catalytic subunit [Philodulcilactobacillus myokoensis]GLB47590.1 aspartate carbamoyltransferase [Philodulcilactobacillus myokoensis]
MKNFLNINRLSKDELHSLITLAHDFKNGKKAQLKKPVYGANLFFENSTRTHSSFQMAELKLGMKLIGINPSTSSVTKGESLSDTIKTLQAIGVDVVVIRHPKTGWYQGIDTDPRVRLSLVNAGDGHGQHPSQSLLDLMTITEEFGRFNLNGLNIGIFGDLSHSRVARSNAQLFFDLGANVYFSGPKKWYPKDFDQYGKFIEPEDVDKLLPKLDVVMELRVQLERFDQSAAGSFTPKAYYEKYGLSDAKAHLMKKTSIIMHPAPVNRGVEIASDLVEAPQSRIFKQMHNGVYARMAILYSVLKSMNLIEEPEYEHIN